MAKEDTLALRLAARRERSVAYKGLDAEQRKQRKRPFEADQVPGVQRMHCVEMKLRLEPSTPSLVQGRPMDVQLCAPSHTEEEVAQTNMYDAYQYNGSAVGATLCLCHRAPGTGPAADRPVSFPGQQESTHL